MAIDFKTRELYVMLDASLCIVRSGQREDAWTNMESQSRTKKPKQRTSLTFIWKLDTPICRVTLVDRDL